jgi:cobalamin transport system permease protein
VREGDHHLTVRRLTPRRLVVTLLGVALFALVAFAVSLAVGGRGLGVLDLRAVLAGTESRTDHDIFFLSRLPRAFAAAVAGSGLAVSGVAFQAVLRNPLAEPYTLGVATGAALGAVLAIRLGLAAVLGVAAVPLFAFAGSLATVALVWRLARVGTSRPPATLLLAGVTLAFLSSAATMFVEYTASFAESYRILQWMMGGLYGVGLGETARSAVVVAAGIGVLLYLARDLNALAAGPDAAASVGVRAPAVVRTSYLSASLIVGAVIAFAGPIGFVGILVPHTLRALVGPDHRLLLPASVLGGAAFVMLSDTIARVILSTQMPVGIVTALLGASFFLFLLLREKTRSRLWSG